MLGGIFDLGFYPDPKEERLLLGKKSLTSAQIAWDVTCWILLALGIFLRQGLQIQNLTWHVERLTTGSLAASFVISFAIFPILMRQVNRRRPRPGLLQVTIPFGFGFFLNLAGVSVYKWFKAT